MRNQIRLGLNPTLSKTQIPLAGLKPDPIDKTPKNMRNQIRSG